MLVIQSCSLRTGVFVAAWAASLAVAGPDRSAAGEAYGPSDSTRRPTIELPSDAAVLRQKVSVPLERLVHPVTLDELADLSADLSAQRPAPSGNPFADDPRPAPEGKLPAANLLEILGRAIVRSTPMPSLDGIREQIPGLPLPAAKNQPPAAEEAAEDPFDEF